MPDMERRSFMAAALLVPSMGGSQMFTQPPTTVGWTEVEAMRAAATRLKRTDMLSGAGVALQRANEEGELAKTILAAPLAATGMNLFGERATAAAWLFTNIGFVHHDLGGHMEALSWWGLAEETAKDANDWSLTSRVLGQRARQKMSTGDPHGAIEDLSRAVEGDRREELNATDMAMLHSLLARANGYLGDEQATLAAIAIADNFMHSQSTPDDSAERPWTGHYDVAHHEGDTGAALRSLAHHGYRHGAAAIGLYEHSLRVTLDGNERSRVLVCGSLARLHLTNGDVDRGIARGHEMLTLMMRNRVLSRRVIDRIDRLDTAVGPYEGLPAVGHLREHIVEAKRSVGL